MADHFNLGNKKDDGQQDQQDTGIIYRQGLQGEEGQDQGDPPITPGKMFPGFINSKKIPMVPSIISR